jgi:hypothetical protein
MNPQPHPIVGQLGVLIFAILVAYFALTKKPRQDSWDGDTINIGYILENKEPMQTFTQTKPCQSHHIPKSLIKPIKPIKKQNTKQTKTQNEQPEYTAKPKEMIDETLFNDCILALVSLGTKKSQSKTIAKNIFDKHNPKTIEDFIKFVYIK